MNYSPILDTWFSSGWLSYGVPALIFIIIAFIRLRQVRKKKTSKKEKEPEAKKKKERPILKYFLAIIAIVGLMMLNGDFNQSWLGYGKSKHIVNVQYIDGKICVTDYLKSAGGKSSNGVKYYRMHIVDPLTGKKQIRFIIGSGAKLLNITDNKAYVSHYGDLWCYDINTGKRIAKYNPKNLPKMYADFAQGVDNMYVDEKSLFITVSCKDGITRYLYPQTNIITGIKPNQNKYVATNQLRIDGSEIKLDDSSYGSNFLDIETKNSDGKRARIYDAKDKMVYKYLSFLNGKPVVINSIDSSFVVLHYENTSNEQFILTCLKLDGSKKLWEIKQTSLNPDYKLKSYKEQASIADDKNGRMFFGIGGELFCVDLKDGKVVWKVQL